MFLIPLPIASMNWLFCVFWISCRWWSFTLSMGIICAEIVKYHRISSLGNVSIIEWGVWNSFSIQEKAQEQRPKKQWAETKRYSYFAFYSGFCRSASREARIHWRGPFECPHSAGAFIKKMSCIEISQFDRPRLSVWVWKWWISWELCLIQSSWTVALQLSWSSAAPILQAICGRRGKLKIIPLLLRDT